MFAAHQSGVGQCLGQIRYFVDAHAGNVRAGIDRHDGAGESQSGSFDQPSVHPGNPSNLPGESDLAEQTRQEEIAKKVKEVHELIKQDKFRDAEALALIQRAQPLPALPAGYPTRTLDAIVPIEFYLDR